MTYSVAVCPICKSHRQHVHFTALDFNQRKSQDIFQYYLCDTCKTIFLSPIPSNLSIYYDHEYPAYDTKQTNKVLTHMHDLEQSKVAILKRYLERGKLIEVGPAAGRFLAAAKAADYEVIGIEQDEDCVTNINNNLKIIARLSSDPATELLKLRDSCDAVVAWHVIEHLANLRDFIFAASSALHSKGTLIVSTPNPESWSLKLFGRYWVHLDAPRHVALYPIHTLDNLLLENNFQRIGVIYNDSVGIDLNNMGWQKSLINYGREKRIPDWLSSKLGRMLSLTIMFFERIGKRGAAYTAIYRKVN